MKFKLRMYPEQASQIAIDFLRSGVPKEKIFECLEVADNAYMLGYMDKMVGRGQIKKREYELDIDPLEQIAKNTSFDDKLAEALKVGEGYKITH